MKLSAWLWILGGGVVAATVARAASASSAITNGTNGDSNVSHKIRLWKKLESIAELDDTQRYTLTLIAKGEGNYNPAAHNGSDSERAASSKATDNNPQIVALAQGCGVPIENLRTGSWGTFQRLAPYLTGDAFAIFGSNACQWADPTKAPGDLDFQIVSAIKIARTLQGYSAWQAHPTVGNLRLGWAAPALMGYLTDNADRIAKYKQHAASAKLPASLVDGPVARFPGNYAEIYFRLRNAG